MEGWWWRVGDRWSRHRGRVGRRWRVVVMVVIVVGVDVDLIRTVRLIGVDV